VLLLLLRQWAVHPPHVKDELASGPVTQGLQQQQQQQEQAN
jgi:hypothetical protein